MQESPDSISGKLRAVKSCWRKATKQGRKRIGGDGASFWGRAATKLFCQERSACNGGRTPAAEEPGFSDTARFEARKEFQNVPAHRVCDFDSRGGTGQFAGVARIPKMIENSFAEHFQCLKILVSSSHGYVHSLYSNKLR